MAKENLDALTGAAGAFSRVHSGVEPERDPGVPAIVRSLGQARSPLGTSQGVLPGPRPRDAVGGSVDVVASLVPEESTVRCHIEPFHMGTQHAYELRRDRNRSRCVRGAAVPVRVQRYLTALPAPPPSDDRPRPPHRDAAPLHHLGAGHRHRRSVHHGLSTDPEPGPTMPRHTIRHPHTQQRGSCPPMCWWSRPMSPMPSWRSAPARGPIPQGAVLCGGTRGWEPGGVIVFGSGRGVLHRCGRTAVVSAMGTGGAGSCVGRPSAGAGFPCACGPPGGTGLVVVGEHRPVGVAVLGSERIARRLRRPAHGVRQRGGARRRRSGRACPGPLRSPGRVPQEC